MILTIVDMSVLLENTCTQSPLMNFIQNVLNLGLELCILYKCISLLVKISMISLISSLSLKLKPPMLVYLLTCQKPSIP